MRKSRNSFFQESSFQSYNPNINMNMNQGPMGGMPNGAPYEAAGNYFYQGPVPSNNYTTQGSQTDIESRLAKIERQLNRFDYRLTKLENSSNVITSEDFDTSNSNMYML